MAKMLLRTFWHSTVNVYIPTYEQINTFSLTSQTTALIVFIQQLGMEALDTTKLKQTHSTALDPGQPECAYILSAIFFGAQQQLLFRISPMTAMGDSGSFQADSPSL